MLQPDTVAEDVLVERVGVPFASVGMVVVIQEDWPQRRLRKSDVIELGVISIEPPSHSILRVPFEDNVDMQIKAALAGQFPP